MLPRAGFSGAGADGGVLEHVTAIIARKTAKLIFIAEFIIHHTVAKHLIHIRNHAYVVGNYIRQAGVLCATKDYEWNSSYILDSLYCLQFDRISELFTRRHTDNTYMQLLQCGPSCGRGQHLVVAIKQAHIGAEDQW